MPCNILLNLVTAAFVTLAPTLILSQSSSVQESESSIVELDDVGSETVVVDVAAEAVIQRSRIKLTATSDGFGQFLSWRGITLGVGFRDGEWRMACQSGDGTSWINTDFCMSSADGEKWLNLDIVRMSGVYSRYYLVFVDGTLVSDVMEMSVDTLADNTSVEYIQPDFAEVEIADAADYDAYPDYVVRTLRKLKLGDDFIADVLEGNGDLLDAVSHRRACLSDSERMQMRELPDYMVDVAAGDLTYGEQQKFLTQTVNREYYGLADDFDITRAPEDACRLTMNGADYLPTIESRSWAGDVLYENLSDNYIERIYGYIVPFVSGTYNFYVSGDDQVALFLSSDGNPANMARIAQTMAATERRAWDTYSSQKSQAAELVADKAYYFEFWHVETEGNDHAALAWSYSDGTSERSVQLIPSTQISAYAAGEPGTSARQIGPTDPSLLELPSASVEEQDDSIQFMSLASNESLLGSQPILVGDFAANGNRSHAYEGGGLGNVTSATSLYPSMYVYSLGDWVQYQVSTSNPQLFYYSGMDIWLKYYATGGTSGGYLSYITASVPRKCNFESGFGDWVNDVSGDTKDWTRLNGSTPTTNTGPSFDHTLATASGSYLYLETTSGYANTSGDKAILLGPTIIPSAAGSTVVVYYHMNGANIGTLYLEQKRKTTWSTLWSKSGQEQTSESAAFALAEVPVAASNGYPIKLRFRAVAAGGEYGDMAIDDVIIFDTGSDTDGDGVPDRLEWIAFGSLSVVSSMSGLALDSDVDLYSNYIESLFGGNRGVFDSSTSGKSSALGNSLSGLGGPMVVLNDGWCMGVSTSNLKLNIIRTGE